MRAERRELGTGEVIRPSTADDIPALGVLFEEVFGAPRPSEVWRWKYFENPRGSASHLCETGGRVVSHCGGTAVALSDGGTIFRALQSTDFMSSRRHPGGLGGGGVFVRTVRSFFERHCGPSGAGLVYGFPGGRHRLLGERLLGYRPVEMVAEFRASTTASRAAAEPLMERHLDSFVFSPSFGAVRDPTYLRWRYLEHPLHRYSIVRSSRLLRPGAESAAIVREVDGDLFVFELGGSTAPGALRRLKDRMSAGAGSIVFWSSAVHPIARSLREAGFVDIERDHPVEARFFNGRSFPGPGELYFTVGDYDVY